MDALAGMSVSGTIPFPDVYMRKPESEASDEPEKTGESQEQSTKALSPAEKADRVAQALADNLNRNIKAGHTPK